MHDIIEQLIKEYGEQHPLNIWKELPPLTEAQAANQDTVELWPGTTIADQRVFISLVQALADWDESLSPDKAKVEASLAAQALIMALVAVDTDNAWVLSVPIPPEKEMDINRAQLQLIADKLFTIAYALGVASVAARLGRGKRGSTQAGD